MSDKGALRIDKAAHSLMEFKPQEGYGMTEVDGYTAFYHEERLYSVRDMKRGTVTLIYADNPYLAIEEASNKFIKFWAIINRMNKLQRMDGKACVWRSKESAMKKRDELIAFANKNTGGDWSGHLYVIPFEGYSDKIKIMD